MDAGVSPQRAPLWYFGTVAAFFGPTGVQGVIVAYLLAIELQQPADRFGLTQMLGQLPLLLLLMVGGWLADRVDARRLLIVAHGIALLLPVLMVAMLMADLLSEPVVILYAVCWGVFSAVATPARDGLLNRIAAGQVQRMVTQATGIQFAALMAGQALAGATGFIGLTTILLLQALMVGSGAFAAVRLPKSATSAPSDTTPAPGRQSVMHEIASGVAVLFATPTIRATFLLVLGMGVFFSGVMVVLIPLAVRDLFAGGASQIAIALLCFGFGMLTTIALLIRRGGLAAPGRALSLSLLFGSVALVPIALPPETWPSGQAAENVFLLCIFAWGCCGGIAMTMSRTILQENAPPSHRARVMAAFSLASTGGAPLGSLMMGFAISALGVRHSVLVPVAGVVLTTLGVLITHPLWRVHSDSAAARGNA